MKNLVAKAGLTVLGSTLLLATAGVKSASALFIEATETFSVSEDIPFTRNSPNDRQFKSYNEGGVPDLLGNSDIVANKLLYGSVAENAAIVGSYESEEVRGLVEFDVRSFQTTLDDLFAEVDRKVAEGIILTPELGEIEKAFIKAEFITSAALNFRVFKLGGLDQAPLPLDAFGFLQGTIDVFYYGGGLDLIDENLYDYGNGISRHGSLNDINGDTNNPGDTITGTAARNLNNPFDTQGLQAGDLVTLSISTAVAEALDQGWEALAFRLQARPATSLTNPLGVCPSVVCSAITFHDFTIGAREVPTPAAILPTIFGLCMASIRKKQRNETLDA